jgi:hypothetical protein
MCPRRGHMGSAQLMANSTEYKTVQSRNSLQQLMWTQIRVHDFDWDEVLAQGVQELLSQPLREVGSSLSSNSPTAVGVSEQR